MQGERAAVPLSSGTALSAYRRDADFQQCSSEEVGSCPPVKIVSRDENGAAVFLRFGNVFPLLCASPVKWLVSSPRLVMRLLMWKWEPPAGLMPNRRMTPAMDSDCSTAEVMSSSEYR